MKFKIGRLGIDLTLSWEEEIDKPTTVIIPPTPPIEKPVPVVIPPSIILIPSAPDKLDKARQVIYTITSAFEGGPVGKINYTNLSGDFDGQGYSIGFLQWCVGQGSDLPLMQMMLEKYPAAMKQALGKFFEEFIFHMNVSSSKRLSWAKSSVNHNGKIDPNWAPVLKQLCLTPEFQGVQNYFANKVYMNAASICKQYGVTSMRAMMLAFDICTQNGSIKQATKNVILASKAAKERSLGRPLKEKELLEIIAIKRAEASNPRWVADVKSRKLCIVYGSGTVHGDKYDLTKMGLTDEKVL